MREFKSNAVISSNGNALPHTEVIHDLYIYPESVNFNKHKESGVKNIAISLSVKEKHRESPLKAVYGKGTHLKQNTLSTVTYNKKQAVFFDEMKIKLPTTVRDEQITFHFYNVQCPVKNPDHAIEVLFYESWEKKEFLFSYKTERNRRRNSPIVQRSEQNLE